MNIKRTFREVFDPIMKPAGFARKGEYYYRMNGSVFQGVILRTFGSYHFEITFSYIPYWAHQLQFSLSPEIEKPYWAEHGQHFSSGELYGISEDELLHRMQQGASLVSEKILPMLDAVKDDDSYLQAAMASFEADIARMIALHMNKSGLDQSDTEFTGEIIHAQKISQYVMLKKAYDEGSFDYTNQLCEKWLQLKADLKLATLKSEENRGLDMVNDAIENHVEMLLEMCPGMPKELALQEARSIFGQKKYSDEEKQAMANAAREAEREYLFSKYSARMEANDLNWILPVFEEASEKMKQQFADVLKIRL